MLLVITHNLVIEMNKDMYVNVRIFFAIKHLQITSLLMVKYWCCVLFANEIVSKSMSSNVPTLHILKYITNMTY